MELLKLKNIKIEINSKAKLVLKQRPPMENRPFIQILPQQGSQLSLLEFGRHVKAGRGVEQHNSEKKGRLQESSDWRLLAWGIQRQANQKRLFYVTGLGSIFSLLWSLEQKQEIWQLSTRSRLFWTDSFRARGLAS